MIPFLNRRRIECFQFLLQLLEEGLSAPLDDGTELGGVKGSGQGSLLRRSYLRAGQALLVFGMVPEDATGSLDDHFTSFCAAVGGEKRRKSFISNKTECPWTYEMAI